MRFICLLILVCLSFQMSWAQSVVQIEKLESKAMSYNRINNDSLLFYAKKVLEYSIAMKYQKGIVIGYRMLSFGNYYKGQNQVAESLAKKAIYYYRNEQNEEEGKSDCYKIIGDVALYNLDFEKAYDNLMRAKVLYNQTTTSKRRDKEYLILNDFALMYILLDDYDKALVILNDVQNRGRNFDNILADTYELFSVISNSQEDYKGSIAYFKKAKILHEKLNDKRRVLICEINLSINYYDLKEYSKAIDNLNKALITCGKTDFLDGMFNCNLYLSKCYLKKKELDQAQFFLDKADKIGITNKVPLYEIVNAREICLLKSNVLRMR
jgi:tetratricopeptide (TPR) repeat protein